MTRTFSAQKTDARYSKQLRSPLRPLNLVAGVLVAVALCYVRFSIGI